MALVHSLASCHPFLYFLIGKDGRAACSFVQHMCVYTRLAQIRGARAVLLMVTGGWKGPGMTLHVTSSSASLTVLLDTYSVAATGV